MPTLPQAGTYRLYMDESGDPVYNLLDQHGFRFLGLVGVWFRRPEPYGSFYRSMEKLKLDTFGPSPNGQSVILHRKDIMAQRGPFSKLRDPAIRQRFDAGLLSLVADYAYTACCVVIDKKNHLDQLGVPAHPYHYCIESMMERYVDWLALYGAQGDAAVEGRGRNEDRLMREAFARFYRSGTPQATASILREVLTSSDLTTCSGDDNVAGIQLADIPAHPLKEQCLAEYGLRDPIKKCFAADLLQAVAPKLNCHPKDRYVHGYGKVMLSTLAPNTPDFKAPPSSGRTSPS